MPGEIASPDAYLHRLRTEDVLFDSMIIRHLSVAGAGPDLAAAFRDRIAWPEAVEAELRKQGEYVPELQRFLDNVPVDVLEVDADDEEEVEDIRRDMWAKGELQDNDYKHLGEAQCLLFGERDGYAFATNDKRARERARAAIGPDGKPRTAAIKPVVVFHVIDVLMAMVRSGVCDPATAWEYYVDASQPPEKFALPGFEIPGSKDRFIRAATAQQDMWRAEQASEAEAS